VEVALRLIALKLSQLVLAIINLVGLAEILGVKLDTVAVEDSPYLLQRRISDIRDATVLNASSNVNLLAHLHSIIALLGDGVPGVLEAIQELPAGSAIPTAADNAAGVWNQLDPYSRYVNLTYGEEQAAANDMALLYWQAGGLPSRQSPFFNVSQTRPPVS